MVFKKKMGFTVTFKNFFLDFLDFLFPNFCQICNEKILRSLFPICESCLSNLESSNQQDINDFFLRNLKPYKYISNFYSRYEFVKEGQFQKVVHQLKYNGKSRIGILLGRELGKNLLMQNWFNEVELIIPVPIHRIKKLQRGYNQSSFICRGISQVTGKSINEKVIKRIRNTQTQTHLHLQERIENVKDAFKVKNSKLIQNKTILIVDDVCTTGSTVNEIAKTLINAGARRLYLATLAFVKEKDFSIQT